MSENPTRREAIIGAASVAVGAALPVGAVAVDASEAPHQNRYSGRRTRESSARW